MSDPIFLRNLINNTVYAEQIHTAQQMAQEASREKNLRVQQQKLKEHALAVEKLDESASLEVSEEGHQDRAREEMEEEGEKSSGKKADDTETEEGGIQRIDITV